MFPSQQQVIIVRKRKAQHSQHHGGAWKVAYADFVTAMLSLFIVLWLLSSSEQVQKAVGGYFTNPKGTSKDLGNGLKGAGSESIAVRKEDMHKLKQKLEEAIDDPSALQKIKEHVILTVTNEGLRVELIEGENSTFFESGNSLPTQFGEGLLKKLAQEIGKLPNRVTMEGHTDSRPFMPRAGYTNWELSADRANAARRWMEANGMRPDQVSQVRGYADRNLRDPAHPTEATNRRVTLIIQYLHAPQPGDASRAGEEPVAAGASKGQKTGALAKH
jgi:chemotaxis protein MotB